jgi:hypothetical protein
MKAKEFVTVKLARDFAVWLKIQAATRQVPIYAVVEQLISKGKKPQWRRAA